MSPFSPATPPIMLQGGKDPNASPRASSLCQIVFSLQPLNGSQSPPEEDHMTAVSVHGLASNSRSKSLDHSNQSSGEDAHLLDSGMNYSIYVDEILRVQI